MTNDWRLVNKAPELKNDEIHVWYVDLDLSENKLEELFNILNAEEKARADRFHFQHDKTRFIAARGMLRNLLGQYINLAPQQLKFNYNQYGKPHLEQKPELQFNVSHAQNKALIAVTFAPAVGIDIEYADRTVDIEGISQRFFSVNEQQTIKSLSAEQQRIAFFNAWVRKEAFLKALGMGLSYSLEKVEVSVLPAQPAKIIALHDPAQKLEEWTLFNLLVPASFQAALVAKNNQQKLVVQLYKFD